jgi:hypothetical protein
MASLRQRFLLQAAMLQKPRSIYNGGLMLGLVILTGLTTGCIGESSKTSSAVFHTNAIGEPVVQATQTALKLSGYRVTTTSDTTDPSGLLHQAIRGERFGMVNALGPQLVYIRIVVTPLEKGSQIEVEVTPPSGAYGTSAIPLHDYQYALSQVLPDLVVKRKQVPKAWF